MQLATADAVQPHEGEAAFILQLRPPLTANAEALASGLDRFTSLFLEQAANPHVRFTPLGALTWALCAPYEHVQEVDAACDELAQTLFGDPASEAVHLARQPDLPRDEDYGIRNEALSQDEGEAVMDDLAEHEWDFALDPDTGEAAAESEDDTIDLDAYAPAPVADGEGDAEPEADAETDEDWAFASDAQSQSEVALDEALLSDAEAEVEAEVGIAAGQDDFGVDFDLDSDAGDAPEPDAFMSEDAFVVETAIPDDDAEPEPEIMSDEAFSLDDAVDALDEALEQTDEDFVLADAGSDDVTAVSDEGLDDFVLEGEESRPPHPQIWDEDVDTVDIDDIAASALHENRLGSNLDVAAELNAFREEMRAIAQSIPSGGIDDTLSEFRASLESLSGELGQRVDGAAQRIEAAVGRLDVDRYDAASQRVESAATLMETSIHEALEALRRAGAAMSAPAASDLFEAQERDSL